MADASSVDFRALQLFIAVYDNQSFSGVARREGVSPSLISRTIQQLEDALGQQLFYRNTRAVVPTEAGRFFAASARELLGQYADAQRALQDRAQVPGGLVRINAPVYFGQRHIAPWLPELAARHPKLQFDLMLTDGADSVTESCYNAARRAIAGESNVGNRTFFRTYANYPSLSGLVIGAHIFSYTWNYSS